MSQTNAQNNLPEQFGTIVYRARPAAATTLYIIANAHRSAISGTNGAETLQAQMETFRIGEWLIRQEGIELLLPEGFFGEMEERGAAAMLQGPLDQAILQKKLADTSQFVNAELLLHANYSIGLSQVEDRELYRHLRSRLRASLEMAGRLTPSLDAELDYLQKLRALKILQTVPEIIAAAYEQGRIAAPKALLTIGLAHLDDILAFLKPGKINLAGPDLADKNYDSEGGTLELLRKQIGVTVIVPHILVGQTI